MGRAPLVLLAAALLAGPAAAQKESASPLGGFGGSGKEPIKIDADRLDVFDRENKAVFAGNVVAVQGDSTIRCSTMTVHYKRGREKDGGKDAAKGPAKEAAKEVAKEAAKDTSNNSAAGKPAEGEARATPENGIQKVECAGPVTVAQKDQVATGDSAVFDQAAKRIVLTGNVVLSQCQNVTRGSRLVYDMNTGRANMDPAAGGRVSAMFVPGEKAEAKGGASKGCVQPAAPKPAADKPAADKAAPKAGDRAEPDAAKARAQAR